MNPADFTTVSYKFKLFDANEELVEDVPFELQYLDAITQDWVTFHSDHIIDGSFFFEEPIDPILPSESLFLLSNQIPELRLVAKPEIYSSLKTEVLAFTCQLKADTVAGTLEFDFGTCYLIEEETLPAGDVFSDFIVITSPISLVNQAANLALIEALQAELLVKNAAISDLNDTIASKDAEITALNNTIVSKNETIAGLNNTIVVKNAALASLNADLLAAQTQVEEKTLRISRLDNINIGLEATNLELEEQVAFLQKQIDIDASPVRVSDLYGQLVEEISSSAKSNSGAGYKLANISLKLKTLVSRDDDGVSAQLLDLSAMNRVKGDAVSELVFDITPEPEQLVEMNPMPNLLGLTETAVRRILTSLDLRLNPVFQNNPNEVDGDSFKQSPEEGRTYNTNDIVTVIFSKHE